MAVLGDSFMDTVTDPMGMFDRLTQAVADFAELPMSEQGDVAYQAITGALAGGGVAKGSGVLGRVGNGKNGSAKQLAGSSRPMWDNSVSGADGDFGYLPTLRQGYVREVYDLQRSVDSLKASGASPRDMARFAYGERTGLKLKYRQYTPPEILEEVNVRNLQKYGNELGPTFDSLIEKGKSFEQIIESATRSGGGDLF